MAALGLVVAGGVWSWSAMHHSQEATVYLAGPLQRVAIDVDRGTVELVGREGAEVQVSQTRRSIGAVSPVTTQRLDDGVLRVIGVCPGGLVMACRTDFRIELPPGAQVEARVGSGSLSVRGMNGSLQLSSGSAAIRLDGIEGVLTARTGSGSIDGDNLRLRNLTVVSVAGDIALSLGTPADSVSIKSGAGDVDLAVPDVPYRVMAGSAIGIVNVDVCQAGVSRQLIDVEATLGDVSVRRSSPGREGVDAEGVPCP